VAKPYPWVRIVSPQPLAEIEASTELTVSITAAAESGKTINVELRDNGQLLHSSTESTFNHPLKGITAGDHTLSARVTDADGATREHAVTFTVFDAKTKDSLPWKEEFTLANQTTTDDSRTSWTASRSDGTFEVRDYALFLNDKGDEGTFRTGEIDISSGPVDISLDVASRGGVDGRDFVRLYQSIDGGPEKLVGEVEDKLEGSITLKGSASGKKLVLIIRAKVSSDDEIYTMDNLTVTPTR
jgi:hypothetical protein